VLDEALNVIAGAFSGAFGQEKAFADYMVSRHLNDVLMNPKMAPAKG
jgi:hypothetical protein